jgi:uncharacterized membrane protein YidH (DUF202 family)
LDPHQSIDVEFGFTIYKFLLYVRESLSNNSLKAQGSRRFGLVLIALGTVSMVFGLIDYYKTYRQFSRTSSRGPWSFLYFAGTITSLHGLHLLVSILLHREVL